MQRQQAATLETEKKRGANHRAPESG